MSGDGLVDGKRQDEFVVELAYFHLVEEPRRILKQLPLELVGCDVVYAHGYLLIFVVLIEVVTAEVGALLGCDDSAHELYGGVVLSHVTGSALGLYDDLLQLSGVGKERHVNGVGGVGVDLQMSHLIAHGTDIESFAVDSLYRKLATAVGSSIN